MRNINPNNYRILTKEGSSRYYPQHRFLLFWLYYYDHSYYAENIEKLYFLSENLAHDFIDEIVAKKIYKKLPNKIIKYIGKG